MLPSFSRILAWTTLSCSVSQGKYSKEKNNCSSRMLIIPHYLFPYSAIVVDILEVLGVIVSLFIVNRYGRRPLLLHTMVFMTATLVVVGGLGIDRNRPVAANRAIAAMIMLCKSI
jgi:hypothetical protein